MPMRSEDRYEANLALLGQKMPDMVDQIRQFPLTNVQLMPTATGHLYGNAWSVETQQWVPLCHATDPEQEAERDCDAAYSRDVKVYCLLGMGLGYFTAAFAKRLEAHQRLVVFDLDPNLYKAALHAADFTSVFSEGKRIDFIIGNDAMDQVERWWLSLDAMDKLYISPPFRAGYTEYCQKTSYDALIEKTVDMMRIHAVGLSTWKTFGAAIGDNDLKNMPEYFLHPGYEHLHGLWKDKPAVCVAAGPSLRKNLKLLLNPEYRAKVLVIAVGTVYAMLQRLGIEPDIVTTIDFQRLNWGDQFQHVPLDDAPPLVYLHSTYPETIRRWPGPRFVAENASDTVGWFRQFSGGKKSAGEVQTVAHLNLLVAAELGANPIILLGQDLSMPHDTHHAPGARAQDQAPNEAPTEAFLEVTDYAGQPVQSRHSFLSMKTVFERIRLAHPLITFVNCSEAGLALQGIPNMPLEPVLQSLPSLEAEAGTVPVLRVRDQIRQVFTSYTPVLNPDLLTGMETLCADVATIADAVEIVQTMASTRGLEDTEAREVILQQEERIQQRQSAFGLFAIRHFGILEFLSEIPPHPSTVPDEDAKAIYNCERLLRISRMITEELPTVQDLLRTTRRRLESVVTYIAKKPMPMRDVIRCLARRQYACAEAALDMLAIPRDLAYKMRGHIAFHRQQYCLAMGFGVSTRKQQQIAWRQWQYKQETGAQIAAYFDNPVEHGVSRTPGGGIVDLLSTEGSMPCQPFPVSAPSEVLGK